jgi:hypothetical protein
MRGMVLTDLSAHSVGDSDLSGQSDSGCYPFDFSAEADALRAPRSVGLTSKSGAKGRGHDGSGGIGLKGGRGRDDAWCLRPLVSHPAPGPRVGDPQIPHRDSEGLQTPRLLA